MNREEFEKLLDELDGNSVSTLKEKNARYSSPDDTLHNFNSGADIMGGTPAQACWGYLTKHLVALRDMVERNNFHNREDFLEKCQDSINYIRFLWCIGNEERKNYVQDEESKAGTSVDCRRLDLSERKTLHENCGYSVNAHLDTKESFGGILD